MFSRMSLFGQNLPSKPFSEELRQGKTLVIPDSKVREDMTALLTHNLVLDR
jgi:hypothetical protein